MIPEGVTSERQPADLRVGHPTGHASTCPGTRGGGEGAGPRRHSGLSLLTPTLQSASLILHNISYIYIVIYIIVIY